tara:strand:+ start:842 stop:1033 length:192 start_codon:yes stop_codon:yes gene_type:complete
MKKTLIVTAVVLVVVGFGVKKAVDAFNDSPLGAVKQLNDRKEAIEKIIEDGPLEIKQPSLKLQ